MISVDGRAVLQKPLNNVRLAVACSLIDYAVWISGRRTCVDTYTKIQQYREHRQVVVPFGTPQEFATVPWKEFRKLSSDVAKRRFVTTVDRSLGKQIRAGLSRRELAK